jgi:ABC-type nitrate/sulfonate/bicarbonate transport system ATPase subunit
MIGDGSVTALVGRSGAGKTTLLNALALDRSLDVSYVFQEPRLIPTLTLEKNIALTVESGSSRDRIGRAREYLARVGLGEKAGEYPSRISGGERQRASLARAFARRSTLLLMDEPFQSQDPVTKAQLMDLFASLQQQERRTVIAVTHEIREALCVADRAVVLSGRPARVSFDSPVKGASHELTEADILKEMR